MVWIVADQILYLVMLQDLTCALYTTAKLSVLFQGLVCGCTRKKFLLGFFFPKTGHLR